MPCNESSAGGLDPGSHRMIGGIAHRDGRGVAISLPNDRRQPGSEDQILSRVKGRSTHPVELRAIVRYRDDAEGRQGIIEWNRDAGVALRIQRDARLPEKQAVEELTHRT